MHRNQNFLIYTNSHQLEDRMKEKIPFALTTKRQNTLK